MEFYLFLMVQLPIGLTGVNIVFGCLANFIERNMKSICVYCGSNPGLLPEYRVAAHEVGTLFAEQNIRLVYGGGRVGLMGIMADACLAAGGLVTGVIPRKLMEKEVGHQGVTELHVVETMHERKALMTTLCEGFIALPGGYGTLDELFEALTWQQLGYHQRPVGLLNVAGFYDKLLDFLDHVTTQHLLRPIHRHQLVADSSLPALLVRMQQHKPTESDKWLAHIATENNH